MTDIMQNLLNHLGVPSRIFQGETSVGPSKGFVEREMVCLIALRKEFEQKVIGPMVKEMVNPLEFFFLLPLGKKAYVRGFSKVPEITWKP